MSNQVVVKSRGVGFGGLLTILFICLKLCDVIDWSWLWVLSPLWIPLALFGGIAVGAFVIGLVCLTIAGIISSFRGR